VSRVLLYVLCAAAGAAIAAGAILLVGAVPPLSVPLAGAVAGLVGPVVVDLGVADPLLDGA
jgi:hypothetical protein